jgi:hypothetical protein
MNVESGRPPDVFLLEQTSGSVARTLIVTQGIIRDPGS